MRGIVRGSRGEVPELLVAENWKNGTAKRGRPWEDGPDAAAKSNVIHLHEPKKKSKKAMHHG